MQRCGKRQSIFFNNDFYSQTEHWKKEQAKFDFIFADLGVSSLQLDEAKRGFFFKASSSLSTRKSLKFCPCLCCCCSKKSKECPPSPAVKSARVQSDSRKKERTSFFKTGVCHIYSIKTGLSLKKSFF